MEQEPPHILSASWLKQNKIDRAISERLMNSLNSGERLEQIPELIKSHPEFDINRDYGFGLPVFSTSFLKDRDTYNFLCSRGIDLNKRDKQKDTLLIKVCMKGYASEVEMLASNPKVLANLKGTNNKTALYVACQRPNPRISNSILCVKYLIASGKDLAIDFDNDGKDPTVMMYLEFKLESLLNSDNVNEGLVQNTMTLKNLLGRFREDPDKVRNEVRMELNKPNSSETFALTVFVCDGYAIIKDKNLTDSQDELKAKKFFDAITVLPIELQMYLSNLACGTSDVIIPHRLREDGFKATVRSWAKKQNEQDNKQE